MSRERDPGLRAEGMLALARREAAAGRLEAAAELYAVVAQEADAVGAAPPLTGDKRERPLRIRAQEGLDAISGRGAIGPRAEFLLRNLARQSSDPAMLFAMGTAGAVYRMTRLATLSRLASTPNPGILTQLIGAGRLASLTGFALEAPAFTLAGRLGSEALGRGQDWSSSALGRDIASSYLVLGGLKLAGWGSGAAYRRFASPVGAVRACPPLRGERPLQTLFQQGGMLGGILFGHALEEHLGLRRPQDGATTLTDSLAMLLQFHVAVRLTRQAFGQRFAAWESNLDRQAATLQRLPSRPNPRLDSTLPWRNAPVLAVASGPGEGPPRLPDRFFSVGGGGRGAAVSAEGAPPEVRPSLDGRSRPVDREAASAIKLIEAQGVFWVIDIDTEARARGIEVRVGGHRLPPGGSLRVRDGELIHLGDRAYRFREPVRDFSPEISSAPGPEGVLARRHLHPYYNQGREARYELRLGRFVDRLETGIAQVFTSGPWGAARLTLRERRALPEGEAFTLEVRDAETAFTAVVELTPDRVVLDTPLQPRAGSALVPMFLDWLSTETLVRASDLQVRGIRPELHELLGYGLIHSAYSRYEHHGDRVDLVTQPRSTLLPAELGPQHREAANLAFDAWARRKFGTRIPTLMEIEDGAALPAFNHLGLEPSMPAILDRLVGTDTRFLEIGYGDRLETLQAVERRGGTAWGLEVNRVYPEAADREALRRSDLDVLFINGSPFLFYAQHHVALPAAVDILRQFPRAQWLVIQAYNPRTPFEILRHAEELNRLRWEPVYYRVAASLDEAPIFPTDWCQRPDTPHAVLIARRPPAGNNDLTPRY
ncbi:MAG: hypothetical protein IT572_01025 [Deltaproteobacteria bacterium]|nr:hypothetical protein [Deltaproteobacteria bacterium]